MSLIHSLSERKQKVFSKYKNVTSSIDDTPQPALLPGVRARSYVPKYQPVQSCNLSVHPVMESCGPVKGPFHVLLFPVHSYHQCATGCIPMLPLLHPSCNHPG